jgi:hypothetical protein
MLKPRRRGRRMVHLDVGEVETESPDQMQAIIDRGNGAGKTSWFGEWWCQFT